MMLGKDKFAQIYKFYKDWIIVIKNKINIFQKININNFKYIEWSPI